MKTSQGTRDALREMAGTTAVKGALLIELLDDVDAIAAELAEAVATLTELHDTILREGVLTERRFLDLGMRVVAITGKPTTASETPAAGDPNNGLPEPSSIPPMPAVPPPRGNMSGTARINIAKVFGKIAAAENSDSDPKKN